MTALPATAAAPGLPVAMTRRRKAAIVVRLLLAEGLNMPLDGLPADLQSTLTRELGQMRYIDGPTLRAVVGEFLEELERIGLVFPGGIDGALDLLDGHINADLLREIRSDRGGAPDPWTQVRAQDPAALIPIAQAESPEVAAILLSKLPTARAAEVLAGLPGDAARRIACAVSKTDNVSPATVEAIGQTLADQIAARPDRAFADPPGERMGAILNLSPAATRTALLDGLQAEDDIFASAVRKAIFTFEDIPARLAPREVPALTRAVAAETLVTALAANPEHPTSKFILENMSRRIADQLTEQIGETGKISTKGAETAQNEIIAVLRDLADAGQITLITAEED